MVRIIKVSANVKGREILSYSLSTSMYKTQQEPKRCMGKWVEPPTEKTITATTYYLFVSNISLTSMERLQVSWMQKVYL